MKSLYIYISALCGAGLLVGLALVYISGTSSIRMVGAVSAILATNVIMIYAKKISGENETNNITFFNHNNLNTVSTPGKIGSEDGNE